MKKKLLITGILFMGFILVVSGCKANGSSSPAASSNTDKLKIVTTLFPDYDFAKAVAGDKADVTLLLPPGAESHSFDPSPADIKKIHDADIFIYTGKYMEPWAQTIIDSLDKDKPIVVDASKGIDLLKAEDEDHHHDAEDTDHDHDAETGHTKSDDGHNHGGMDPHIWTSPVNAIHMVKTIADAIIAVDGANTTTYRANADTYIEKLTALDKDFRKVVSEGNTKEIFFGDRFAMHYFVKAYGLDEESVYDSCSEETEPTAADMAEIIKEMKEDGIKVIYYQELADPKAAKTIAEATGAKPLLLHSAHNLSKEDFAKGLTYIDLMKNNLINLKEGLTK